MNEKFYLLKIELLEVEPTIWREFVVPSGITLDRLHDIIQIVMGWTDSHLHQFIIGKTFYTESPETKQEGKEEGKYRLNDLVKRKGRKIRYRYDFGDSWSHDLTIIDNNYKVNPFSPLIKCLDGERMGPPEDIGGSIGYLEFCDAMKDKTHVRYEDFKELIDSSIWQEDKFHIQIVNSELIKYLVWTRDRILPWVEF